MKRVLLASVLGIFLVPSSPANAHAQLGIITGFIKRAIMAIDLRIQRQQTQTILLQDAQKQLENWMQKTRLADISDWVQQQKDLYDEYYQELWEVKDALRYYPAVKEVIEKQTKLIKGCKQAYAVLTKDKNFNAEEIGQMGNVYDGVLRRSGDVVRELEKITNAFVTQMDDGDRLAIINELSASIDRDYRQLQAFSQDMMVLSLQRVRSENDLNFMRLGKLNHLPDVGLQKLESRLILFVGVDQGVLLVRDEVALQPGLKGDAEPFSNAS